MSFRLKAGRFELPAEERTNEKTRYKLKDF
jgi:hypothetical protein